MWLVGKKIPKKNREWTVETKDLIELLSKRLYNEKEAAVRELMQNAIDSGTKKIEIEANERFISIEDFGTGMSSEEVDKYLLAIGKSLKRLGSLGDDDLQKTTPTGNGPIGEFGIGFIASFCLSEWVLVETIKADKTVLLLNKSGDIAELNKVKNGNENILNELELKLALGTVPPVVDSVLKEILLEKPKKTRGTRVMLINPRFAQTLSGVQEFVEEEIKKRFASVETEIYINGKKIDPLRFEDYFTEKGVFKEIFKLEVENNLVLFSPGTKKKSFYTIFIKRVFNSERTRPEGNQLLVNSATIKPTLSRDGVKEESYAPFEKKLRLKLVEVFLRAVEKHKDDEILYKKIWQYTLPNLTLVAGLRLLDAIKDVAELKILFGFVHLPIVHGYSVYSTKKWLSVRDIVSLCKEKKVLLYCNKKDTYVDSLAHDHPIIDLEESNYENADKVLEHVFKELYNIELKEAAEVDVEKDVLRTVEQKDYGGLLLLVKDMLLHMGQYHKKSQEYLPHIKVVVAELRDRRGLYDPSTNTIYLEARLDFLRKIQLVIRHMHLYFPETPSKRIDPTTLLRAMRARLLVLDTSIIELYELVSHEFAHALTDTTERMHSPEFYAVCNDINHSTEYVMKRCHDKALKTVNYLEHSERHVDAINAGLIKAGVKKEVAEITAVNTLMRFITPPHGEDKRYIDYLPKEDRLNFLTAFGVCSTKTKLPKNLYTDLVRIFKALFSQFYDPEQNLQKFRDRIGGEIGAFLRLIVDESKEWSGYDSPNFGTAITKAIREIFCEKHKEDVKKVFDALEVAPSLTEKEYEGLFVNCTATTVAVLWGEGDPSGSYSINLSPKDRVFSDVYALIIKKQITIERQYLLVDDAIRITTLAKEGKFYHLPFLSPPYFEAVLDINNTLVGMDKLSRKKLIARVFEFYSQNKKDGETGMMHSLSMREAVEYAMKKSGVSVPGWISGL